MLSWLSFSIIIISLLVTDLKFFNHNSNNTIAHSLKCSFFYILISLLFGLWLYCSLGLTAAGEYFNIYIIEKLLALDNILVISVIFSQLRIPAHLQQRVLTIGIISVIILRGIMISCGVLLIQKTEFIIYIFSVFLILTGCKLLFTNNQPPPITNNFLLKFIGKYFNITAEFRGEQFWLRKDGKLYFTHLMVALVLIEAMDLVFAIDSIPAAFTITHDTYIIFTANIFAVMGLRALYFALNQMILKFKYLHYSLAIILIFIGAKIYLEAFIHISATTSLLVTLFIMIVGIICSLGQSSSLTSNKTH